MIVHPIGMMRANAAAGLNFVDDFTSYTLGAKLRDQTPYTHAGGTVDVIIADSGGVRVARLPSGQEIISFTGGAFATDREISVTVKTLGQTDYLAVYLNYIDATNYTWMTIAVNGWLGIEQKVAGVSVFSQPTSSSVSAGDKFTISRTGTSVMVKRNDVQVGSVQTADPAAEGSVRLNFRDVASPSSFWEISKFEVKDI